MALDRKPYVRSLVFLPFLLALSSSTVFAQTLVERSVESRFQIDLQVPDAALKTYLPQGWTSNVAQQGQPRTAICG